LHVTHGGGNIAAGGKERKRIRQPTQKKKKGRDGFTQPTLAREQAEFVRLGDESG